MVVAVDVVVKKLALWHTATFRPILTHDDLEPIMIALGFAALPATSAAALWREYAFHASNPFPSPPPARAAALAEPPGATLRPRLPSPRIDGLHLLTYKAFFAALAFNLGAARAADLFHVRAMHITQAPNRAYDRLFRPMKDCEMDNECVIVYRDGTLDQLTKIICNYIKENEDSCDKNNDSNNSDVADPIYAVHLKDLCPQDLP